MSLLQNADYINGAEDIEDLQYRCAVAEQEWGKTGLSDRYYAMLRSAVASKRRELNGSGGIAVEIDGFTPCLKRVSDGQILKTTVSRALPGELKGYNKKSGWYVDWEGFPDGTEVYKLCIEGSDEIEGLVALHDDPDNDAVYMDWIVAAPHNQGKKAGGDKKYQGVGGHLYAIGAQRSVELGHGGFMHGIAANSRLLKHYMDTVGAKPTGAGNGYGLYIDEKAAARLLEKYSWTTT